MTPPPRTARIAEIVQEYRDCRTRGDSEEQAVESLARALAAIEAQAAPPDALREALNVEQLARAMARCAEVGPPANHTPEQAEEHWRSYRMEAEEYAREYAALAAAPATLPAIDVEPGDTEEGA